MADAEDILFHDNGTGMIKLSQNGFGSYIVITGYGVYHYDIGTGFGHFGDVVEDVARTVDLIKM
ncbi:hypothetical protein TanjilG_11059 [Lupinus angustifolius]|uniref:Uncharacterized protein n=1 Tax=Lupinus angustifolius TaxID=3871 RepID=A0A1J7HA24_LUPAN|nr:hypothetical protein TanjilG_11059 [Lupinus angustifolius]